MIPEMRTRTAFMLIAAKVVMGGCLVFGVMNTDISPIIVAHPAPSHGDDNGDGHIDEDESGWDCATMGNLICG